MRELLSSLSEPEFTAPFMSLSEHPMGPHNILNCRFKHPALILGELGSATCFCPRGTQRRGCKQEGEELESRNAQPSYTEDINTIS